MFWDNFERICHEAHTTPSGACVAVGIGPNRPSNWKKTGTIPKQEELKVLARHLGCTVADFFKDDDDRKAEKLAKLLDARYSGISSEAAKRGRDKVMFLIGTEDEPKPKLRKLGEGSEGTSYMFEAPIAIGKDAKIPDVSDLPRVEDTLDDYERDFIRIYESLDPKTRIKLMNAVYEFDTEDDK